MRRDQRRQVAATAPSGERLVKAIGDKPAATDDLVCGMFETGNVV